MSNIEIVEMKENICCMGYNKYNVRADCYQWSLDLELTYIRNADDSVIRDEISTPKSPRDTRMSCLSYLNKRL